MSDTQTEGSPVRLDRAALVLVGVLCGSVFLDSLDLSMVGIALPSIDGDLGLSTSTLQWIVGAYALGYGGFLLLGGRTADLAGRRRVFLLALGVDVAASLLCGLASDGPFLVAMRFVKGISGAFTAPAGMSIITTSFADERRRNRALAMYTSTAASGYALGLVLGGFLTSVHWRLVLLVPALASATFLVAGRRVIPPDSTRTAVLARLDVLGSLTLTGALLALVASLTLSVEHGWGGASPALLVVAALLVAAFRWRQRHAAHPTVPPGSLTRPGVRVANVVALSIGAGFVAFQFVTTILLQVVVGWTPVQTAFAFLPGGIIVTIGALRAGGLLTRWGSHRLMVAGMASFAIGYAWFTQVGEPFSYVQVMLPTMVLLGVGFALGAPASNVAATSSVAPGDQGIASGAVSTSLQVGGAVGVAIAAAVMSASSDAGSDAVVTMDACRAALVAVTAMSAAGLLGALGAARRYARIST